MGRLSQRGSARVPMRAAARGLALLALLGCGAGPAPAQTGASGGCSCFSPELQLKTARDTLGLASLAAFGRVVALQPDGGATLAVSEAYKGTQPEALLALGPAGEACRGKALAAGQAVLLLAFGSAPDLCGTYEADHFLVAALRSLQRPGGAAASPVPGASAP